MALLSEMLATLVQMEFFQLLFPFLLALAIMYGVLTWALEKQIPKSARGIISIIFALFVMLYASMNPSLYLFITALSGPWLMIASALLFVVVLLAMVGLDIKTATDKSKWSNRAIIFALLIVGIFAYFFMGFGGFNLYGLGVSSDMVGIVVFIIILVVVMHYLTNEGEKKEDKKV